MRKVALAVAALAVMAGLGAQAEAQPSGITPSSCTALDESMNSAIDGERKMARATDNMHTALISLGSNLQGNARLKEGHQALLGQTGNLLESLRKHLAAMEDFQHRLRECGRGAR